MNILLDYAFPISSITPTPAASTGFLKQVCLVCKPNGGGTAGDITECVSNAAVAVVTNNTEAAQLFAAGMNKVYILQADDLQLGAFLEGHESDFYTVLVSSDFVDGDITVGEGDEAVAEVKSFLKVQDILYTSKEDGTDGDAITIAYTDTESAGDESVTVDGTDIVVGIEAGVTTATQIKAAVEAEAAAHALVGLVIDDGDESDVQAVFAEDNLAGGVDEVAGTATGLGLGDFSGVVGLYSQVQSTAASYAATEKYCGFFSNSSTKAKNMCFAFGSMLSNALNWVNQQYITMPYADDIDTLGEAETCFDDKVSFVIEDDEFGERLALFACGGKAIVGPYIKRNLEIDMQSEGLQFLSGSQPTYTKKNATLLENALQDVVQSYIDRGWIEAGTVSVLLEQDNFVASAYINIAEPKALWRVFGEMRQTL